MSPHRTDPPEHPDGAGCRVKRAFPGAPVSPSATALLLALSLLALSCAHAEADEPVAFTGKRVMELLPANGIVGDGTTTAALNLLALGPDGAPLTGLVMKGTTTTGAVGSLVDVGGGLYRMEYTPPRVDAPVEATLTLKGKIGKENFSGSWPFPIVPSRTHQLQATVTPARLTLGEDATATISVRLASGDRQALTGVDLDIRASAGSVENITHLGGGQFSALYRVPTTTNPQTVLITVVDRADPQHSLAAIALPMAARSILTVNGTPKSEVVVKIGEHQFGPVPADKRGVAKVPVLLQPGVTNAEKLSVTADGQSVREPLDLKLPEAPRIGLFPTPTGVPADARVQVLVHASVILPDGKPDTTAQVQFTTSAGVVGPARHLGGGIYEAVLTPPNSAVATTLLLGAELLSGAGRVASPIKVSLVGSPVSTITATPTPAVLPANAESFKLLTHLSGADGAGLPGRTLALSANGARLNGVVKDAGKGDYVATFDVTGKRAVELTVSATMPVTGNPLYRLLLVPRDPRLLNDGLSSTLVSVATVDEFGYPVAGVPVEFVIESGDGSIPAAATTSAAGVAQVYYTAGLTPGLVRIKATALNQVTRILLVQAPAELRLPELPPSGNRADWALAEQLRQHTIELEVPRQ